MKKSLLFLTVLLIATGISPCFAQVAAINNLKTKYLNWLTGEGVDYSRTEVSGRYNRYNNNGTTTKTALESGTPYNLDNPGAVWNIVDNNTDRSAYTTFVESYLIRVVFPYCLKGPIVAGVPSNTKYHDPAYKALILKCFNYLKAKGINSNTDFTTNVDAAEEIVEMGGSTALRSAAYATCVLMMKDELVEAGEFTHHLGAIGKLTEFLSPSNTVLKFTYPGSNTDMIRSLTQSRLCYVLAEDDSQAKVDDMERLKNYINNALKIGYGWSDCIKPDYITYHHRGPYSNSYGVDAMNQISVINLMLKNTPYELSTEAQSNVKKTVLNWLKYSNGFELNRGLTGRFPTSTTALNSMRVAMANLYVADAVPIKM